MVQKNCRSVFFVIKNTDLRNCARLSKHCTRPVFEDEMCPRRTLRRSRCVHIFLETAARTRFGDGGGKLDCGRARGVLNSCAKEAKARTGRVLRGKPELRPRSVFFLRGPFQGCTGRWTAGCWLARRLLTSSRPPLLWISVFQFCFFFLYDVWP